MMAITQSNGNACVALAESRGRNRKAEGSENAATHNVKAEESPGFHRRTLRTTHA